MDHNQSRTTRNQHLQAADGHDTQSLWQNARPLSDIREITEPNLLEPTPHHSLKPLHHQRSDRAASFQPAPHQFLLLRPAPRQPSHQPHRRSPIRSASTDDRLSVFSIPPVSVPPRSSSKPPNARLLQYHHQRERSTSVPRESAVPLPPSSGKYHIVANKNHAQSPVKEAFRNTNVKDASKYYRVPSKTIVKVENPSNDHILDHPVLQHPRLKVDLLVAAPLFVGGSSVEGVVRIVVDDAERVRHKKALALESVSIDLLGLEEVLQPTLKRKVFLALGNELVGSGHAPPVEMVESTEPQAPQERSWILVSSISTLPFLIKLPLNVGPPPFRSKVARIRYVISATLIIKDAGRQLAVRSSQETALLSVQDPERALVSLPSPLTATEVTLISRSRQEAVTLTAGLHRQVWVSGTNLFTDVHILNDSHKTVKKLELRLERIVLCYNHAAASTLESSASGARMFDQKERETIVKALVKPGVDGWSGALPFTAVLRTCGIEVPRGHASITCHSFFEVRYYLYVSAFTTRSRVATVQLPIQIVHMNSLDVPTNSVAQVAAAIEERNGSRSAQQRSSSGRKVSKQSSKTSLPGRAFTAPRQQSLDRSRLSNVTNGHISGSNRNMSSQPSHRHRGHTTPKTGSPFNFQTPPSNRKGRIFGAADADEISRQLQRLRQNSEDSSRTKLSFRRGRQSARQSPSLSFMPRRPGSIGARTTHDDSLPNSQRPSVEVPVFLDRIRHSSVMTNRGSVSAGKGKARALDW